MLAFNNAAPKKKEISKLIPTQVEEKLQFSELRYRRLFETARDGILILDALSGKITDANPFLKEILGYSQIELLGKQLWQIGVFKDIVDSKKAFLELQNNGYIRYMDLPLQTKDGRSIDVEFVSNVYMVDTEKVIQCNIRDITERRTAEKLAGSKSQELEKLSQTQEETKQAMLNVMEDLESAKTIIEIEKIKDEAMLASIGEGLIAVDNDSKIMVINEAAEKMLGWKKSELIGKKLTSLSLEDEEGHRLSAEKRPTYISLSSGQMTRTNYFFVRKDKTRFPIAITVTPIKHGGKTLGAIDIFRDITHEKEVDRAKSEFVSLASHQLRTPLGIIKWYLEALSQDVYFKEAPGKLRDYFDEIYKSNERVLSLVRSLLSVSRIDQGQIKNTPKPVDFIKTIIGIVEQMKIAAHIKRILLDLTLPSRQIPAISIDGLMFHEVIENLISNAIEYTKPGGSVQVSIEKTEKELLIIVKDTGIGISKTDQKKLFTKFFRSEQAFTHNPDGVGLGLYVVKSYVNGWGGSITVKSQEKKGSTFTVSIPFHQKNSPQNQT